MNNPRIALTRLARYQELIENLIDSGEVVGFQVDPIHVRDVCPYFAEFGGKIKKISTYKRRYHVTVEVLGAKLLSLYDYLPPEFAEYYKGE